MSDAAKAFRAYLITKSGVTNEISTRIYPDFLPQTVTLPAAVVSVISDVKTHDLSGASQHAIVRLQLDLFAASKKDVQDAAEAIRNAADGYRGTAGAEYFETCFLDQQLTDVDSPTASEQLPRYRITQDWRIGLRESTPTL